MSKITLRVIDGSDRGTTYDQIEPPITIGREEGNSIQLNDERVSRFHVKIQKDHDDVVLTDLQSTNGTKVNGEETQLRILRFGDMISLGRTTLLYGSRDEINQRMAGLNSDSLQLQKNQTSSANIDVSLLNENTNFQLKLMDSDPPGLPSRLSPGQAAQTAELLEFFHLHIRRLMKSVETGPRSQVVQLNMQQWQHLVDLQARLAEYLRNINRPPGDG